jgi:hypothetical protein
MASHPETTSPSTSSSHHAHSGGSTVDINEYGAERDGARQTMNRRLFMQLLVLESPANGLSPNSCASALKQKMEEQGIAGVVYDDVNHPRRLGLLTFSENPTHFVDKVRPLFGDAPLSELNLCPEFTMMGRTYSSGYEPDLAFWLLKRPADTSLNPNWPWAVWYPLRRSGEFAQLEPREQGGILREHAQIGRAYGEQDLAHDVRLACHGLDANDNEFVIGLIGKELHPLSHVVQSMRKTKQTSQYINQMGPFFVGYVRERCFGTPSE